MLRTTAPLIEEDDHTDDGDLYDGEPIDDIYANEYDFRESEAEGPFFESDDGMLETDQFLEEWYGNGQWPSP